MKLLVLCYCYYSFLLSEIYFFIFHIVIVFFKYSFSDFDRINSKNEGLFII
jgi:hypothetical protein